MCSASVTGPMTVDRTTLFMAVHFLKRVIPAGHVEQDELFRVINRLQLAGQSQRPSATDSNHSDFAHASS
jgi:hypothetical protein